MPVIGVIIAVAVDVAAEVGAADLIATVAAGTIFADAAGTLTVIGDIAAGALGGLVGGAVTAAITGGDPLTGALEGAAGGALGGGITGLSSGVSIAGGELPTSAVATDVGAGTLNPDLFYGLASSVASATGLPTQAVNVVLKSLTNAATGALKSAATGGDPAQGALGGAITGGVGAGLGAGASNVIDVNQIASDTGLPDDVVKGVIQGLGQAATGAAASAATGGDPGIAAAGDFASGVIPTAIKYAEDGAKSLFNTLVSGGQAAIQSVVDAAQTQLTSIQQDLAAAKAPLESSLQQAQSAVHDTFAAAKGDDAAITLIVGQLPQDSSGQFTSTNVVPLSLDPASASFIGPSYTLANNYLTALQNLNETSSQVQEQWDQIQTSTDQQAQQIIDGANKKIAAYQDPNAAAAQYFDQAYQTAAQGLQAGDSADQIQAALDKINPISSAQAATPLSPSQYSGPYDGATITYDPGDGSGIQTAVVDHVSQDGTMFILKPGSPSAEVGIGLVKTITAPSGPGTNFDFSGNFNAQTPTPPPAGQPSGTPQPDTSDTGASTGTAGSGTGTGTGISGATTAPTATNPDQQIMQLVGLTSPESAGAAQPAGNAAPSRTNFDFSKAGFNSGAPQQQQPGGGAINIEPGSAALAQALSIPGAGPGLGGDIFGTKGKRTPIWNLESLRSEDTSGV